VIKQWIKGEQSPWF